MANQNKGKKGPVGEPWFKNLKVDSEGGARAFVGFLKEPASGSIWRLYLNLDLTEYLEIPQQAILGSRSLSSDSNPLGGTVVWVDAKASLKRVSVKTREAQADFIRGDIVRDYLSAAGQEMVSVWSKYCEDPGQPPVSARTICFGGCFSYSPDACRPTGMALCSLTRSC